MEYLNGKKVEVFLRLHREGNTLAGILWQWDSAEYLS